MPLKEKGLTNRNTAAQKHYAKEQRQSKRDLFKGTFKIKKYVDKILVIFDHLVLLLGFPSCFYFTSTFFFPFLGFLAKKLIALVFFASSCNKILFIDVDQCLLCMAFTKICFI